ncbi:unnamed protein product [Camellia sinensis]
MVLICCVYVFLLLVSLCLLVAMSAELKLSQSNRIFRPNEPLEGKIITKLPSSISHNGIRLTVNGSVTLQVRGGSVGVIESLYGVLKPIPIVLGLMFVGGLVLAYASEHLGIGSFLRGFEEHMFLMLIFLGL